MNIADLILIVIVAFWLFFACRHMIQKKKQGKCIGCSGCDGNSCPKCKEKENMKIPRNKDHEM